MEHKKEIEKLLNKETGEESNLETPPSRELGDFAFPCFGLAKKFKKNPVEIARELKEKLEGKLKFVEMINAKGAYLNFFVEKKGVVKEVLNEIFKKGESYGSEKEKKKILVEFPAPNTNKPLHIGHVRNICLGQSISNILEFFGNKAVRVNLNNDRGIHICKSMLAYQKFGQDKTPEKIKKKSDHFVGDYYVMFNEKAKLDPNLEIEAFEMLKKWENNDKEVRKLWKKMNNWALDGFNETYKKFNLRFDRVYNESEFWDKGKEIVMEGLKNGVFRENKDGNIIAELGGLGEKVLLRSDFSSIYMTQDLYLAKLRHEQYKFDKCIYVVANEQDYHFKALFRILKLLKWNFWNKLHNLAYGYVNLPEGRMKSREGKVVDADDFINEIFKLTEKEIKKRYKSLSKKETEKRVRSIGMGALRFFMLKHDVKRDFVFNPDESISFDGETGPYVQYAYARICSILRKNPFRKSVHGKGRADKINLELLKEQFGLVKKLEEFKFVVRDSADFLNPALIARYLFELSQEFNNFYRDFPVLKAESKELVKARVSLIKAVKIVLENGLRVLNIDAPEKM